MLCGAVLAIAAPFAAAAEEVEAKATLASLFGDEGAQSFAQMFEADHEFEFEIYTPKDYNPDTPAGVFVFISPSQIAEIPQDLKRVFDKDNLIWISVAKSGNGRGALSRVVETLASISYAQREYKLDTNRYYLGGFSGGGRVASITAMFYPEVFNGMVYICGVDSLSAEPNAMVDQMKPNRFVFLTGTEDFNRRETQKAFAEYKKEGFEHIKLMISPAMGHRMPDPSRFDDAIQFLDGTAK